MTEGVDPGPESLASRLDKLFRTIRRPDGSEHSHREVAEAITNAGEPISHSYIGQLRAGDRDNPTVRHLRALAGFFGVPVEYFISDAAAAEVGRELDLLVALRELRVRTVALRQNVLPEAERTLVEFAKIVEVIRELEQRDTTGPPAGSSESG